MATSPGPPVYSPGLLFSHDWGQLHTPRALVDTTIKETDPRESYQTVTFPITNAVQFEAFTHGLGRCDVRVKKNCPLHLLPGYESENAGTCGERPLSAVVKMVYKVTHKLSQTPSEKSLSEEVIKELRDIEYQAQNEFSVDAIVQFLKKFGSHFPLGVQKLGKCFSWMVVVEGKCNMDLLGEIAKDIFELCSRYETHISGSHEGLWYSLHNVLNATSWDEDKKEILQSARLCVGHHGANRKAMTFSQWKLNDFVYTPVKLDPMSDHLVSVWDLIEQSNTEFQPCKNLASMVEKEWKRMVDGHQHRDDPVPTKLNPINIPRVHWGNLLDELDMKDYFPARLTLQTVRSLHGNQKDILTKKDLAWKVLNKIMFLDSECREKEINKYSNGRQPDKRSIKDRLKKTQIMKTEKCVEIPHPMDVTLLIFLCSDFMLRQVLAKKLSMCCLAIPFIIPMPEDRVEILLWPLRSIVMEWCDKQGAKEEALVKCKLNLITFMRFGETRLSKSKLMNTILSRTSHDTFYHRDTACGGEKRKISNGTVEMSHFLPSASEDDYFPEPALFFNLRGDACDYPVQHSLMMELDTVLVILVDLQELQTKAAVQNLLCDTVNANQRVVFILTDNTGHTEEELDSRLQVLKDLLGDALNHIEIVSTFEDGKERNSSKVNEEIRDNITRMMVNGRQRSLEDFAALTNKCHVDETAHHCKTGKRVTNEILEVVKAITFSERKRTLLPNEESLHETGKLLRKLHRTVGKETSLEEKEKIKKHLETTKNDQISASQRNVFLNKVIAMFQQQNETKEFAIQWVKMELDAISRTVLPQLKNKKNKMCTALMKAKDDAKESVRMLEQEICSLEKQIDDATFGLEHIMREMANTYDAAVDLKHKYKRNLSTLPDIVAHLLLEGHPMELMDGDHGFIPLSWVKAVFHSLAKLVGEKKIFVLSVMGIQSSGKSTLLNTLFGLEFAVSAGRCTKGIYAQLLPVTSEGGLPFDYMLVLDSEGLRALELGQHNYEHDNELATLIIGLSDLALINVKGENVAEITDILQIVVLAFLRMKLADSPHRKQCMFIHQNVSAVNAVAKLTADRQKFHEQLNKMTQQASESLHQNITSFNHIISFDGQQDVLYFPDLWEGDPPMATVNKGYSSRAADTQQRILAEVSQNMTSFLTVTEFQRRITDIWNGVLSDDFIFNFRNSLAAKAYLDLEREFARLTMEIEKDLLFWVNTTCNVQMQNCKTEPDVNNKYIELIRSLEERIKTQLAHKLVEFQDFCEKHPTKEVILQWQTEKEMSLKMFGEMTNQRMHIKLTNMKTRRKIEVQQQHMSHAKEQDIMRQAIALAVNLRGHCSEETTQKAFDEIWIPWSTELLESSKGHQPPQDVYSVLYQLLRDIMSQEGSLSALTQESEKVGKCANATSNTFTALDLDDDYISVECRMRKAVRKVKRMFRKDDSYHTTASELANAMMTAVMEKVETICQQDVMFDQHHGKQVLKFAMEEVTRNNKRHEPFSFKLQFRAMFGLRVLRIAAPKFENMNKKFEAKHGIQRKLDDYRQLVFKQFKNAVQNASTEVMISDGFCENVKGALSEYVRLQIDQQVVKELYSDLGLTKHDLMIKMLDDIAETKNVSSLFMYVKRPGEYARKWVQSRGENLIFGEQQEESNYKQCAAKVVEHTIAKVQASAQIATQRVLEVDSAQFSNWLTFFREAMDNTIPLNTEQLELLGNTIKDFKHFQKCVEDNLKNLEGDLKKKLCKDTPESVTWADGSPFLRVYQRLWGCEEICPTCKEPCQYSDPNHTTSHSCIQHRPSGVRGIRVIQSQLLSVTTCSEDVASERNMYCSGFDFKCRDTPHCTATEEEVLHPCREYKKFIPDWDIAPDPSGEAAKFWQWVMCTFQDELVKEYKVKGVEIPESWNKVTEQEARDSLRVFYK